MAATVIRCDFLVVGGGIVGLSIARELKARHANASVCLIEKEPACGLHASGRNSGVIHAGFYYSADSLKARFTREGNLALTAYCREHGLALNPCGKLVVAQSADDLPALDELLRRGKVNGVPLEPISAEDAHKIEPRVKTWERAIFSPSTASADPAAVIESMHAEALREGIRLETSAAFLRKTGERTLETTLGTIEAVYLINAAGLYADAIARAYGFSKHYRILPFKGLYLYSDEPVGALRTHVYPVPNLLNPFLGVHFTVTVNGHAKIGPTAIPALWREQYQGLDRFDLAECLEVAWRELGLFFSSGFDFRRLAMEELRKYSRSHLVGLAGRLLEGVRLEDYRRWGRSGIRAQLIDLRTRKLEMDFVLEGDEQSLHVLNAVSPGWTCALPFARHVVDRINTLLGT